MIGLFKKSSSNESNIAWLPLENEEQLQEIRELSQDPSIKGVVIFKHSTRCSISSMAKNRLERGWDLDEGVKTYFLDLIEHRTLSDKVAEAFEVPHASPQLLLIQNGDCTYQASHGAIDAKEVKNHVRSVS